MFLVDVLLYLLVAVVSCAVVGLFFRGRSSPKLDDGRSEGSTSTDGPQGPGTSSGRSRLLKNRSQQVLQISRQVWRRMPSAQTWLYGTDMPGRKRVKKRQRFINLAKAILRLKEAQSPPREVKKGPPPAFLEADWAETQSMLPPEVFYMLKSVRVFGHFEKPLFLELCKHLETCFLPAGATLFRVGQLDDSIYVVQSGKLHVVITDPETGREEVVKEVSAGHSVYSLLSILDCITGQSAPYTNISARSVQNTTVLRLPAKAFEIVFTKYPDSLVRVVQIIMVRLQRVAFLSLNKFLGLSSELIHVPERRQHESRRNLKIFTLQANQESKPASESSPPEEHQRNFRHSEPIPVTPVKPCRYCLRVGCSGDCSHYSQSPPSAADPSTGTAPSPPISTSTSSPVDVSSADFKEACAKAGLERPQFFLGSSDDEDVAYSMMTRRAPRSSHAQTEDIQSLDDEDVGFHDVSNATLLEYGTEDMATLLGLNDTSALKGRLRLRHFPAGETIIEEDCLECDLIFVLTGCLQARMTATDEGRELVYDCIPATFVGTLCALTGERSLISVKAKVASSVLCINKTHFYSLLRLRPQAVLNVASDLLSEMSPFLRQMDYALDWELIEAGRAVYRQGDHANNLYIVLTGRLRSVVKHKVDHKELVGEYGRGDTVGVAEVLTGSEYGTTVHAVRDTELATIPRGLLNYIKRQHPHVVSVLIHWLGQRVLGSYRRGGNTGHKAQGPVHSTNLANIAVLPVSKDVPLSNFTTELCRALNFIGPALRLTSSIVEERLGSAALDSYHEYRLLSWLGQQEDVNRIVVYQTDKVMSMWTQRCIRQADCILIVGMGNEEDPSVGELEAELDKMAVRAQKELVLLHRASTTSPQNTVEWLVNRGWCSAHHHIQCPDSIFEETTMTEKEREKFAQMASSDRKSDFARLARRLTGTSIALVLGGGGARGLSQPGVIKALEEAGLTFDMVGGSSIGALVGAVYCEERNADVTWSRVRDWAMDFGVLWRKVMDITWPTMSLLSGKSINNSLKWLLKEKQIEDLWIPYFCTTTDITQQSSKTHHSGSLWRYVRASMTLTGYYPPMCDPMDGHLLVDGGYTNNLPTDVMRSLGVETVVAIDVGSRDDKNLTNYGDFLSGWSLLWNKIWPWAKPVRIPDLAEIQSRLAYVSCVRQLEQAKNSDYVVYLRPPIDKYGTLAFLQGDEIVSTGLEYGRSTVEKWKHDGTLDLLVPGQVSKLTKKGSFTRRRAQQKAQSAARSFSNLSFTNLAEMASRIQPPDDRGESRGRSKSFSSHPTHSSSEPSRHSRIAFSKSLVFPKEYQGYSSDVSDEEGLFSADDLHAVTHAVRLASSSNHARHDGDDDDEDFPVTPSVSPSHGKRHTVAFSPALVEHQLSNSTPCASSDHHST